MPAWPNLAPRALLLMLPPHPASDEAEIRRAQGGGRHMVERQRARRVEADHRRRADGRDVRLQHLESAGEAAAQTRRLQGRRRSPSGYPRSVAETNDAPNPFPWTADPDAIIDEVRRG